MEWNRKKDEALALHGHFFGGDNLKKQAYPRPDRQLLGFTISPKLLLVFGLSCMRQKLVPCTVWRPNPTLAVRVQLSSIWRRSVVCLRGLDHLHRPTSHSICGNLVIYKPSLMNDRLMFEHDKSFRAYLLPIHFPALYEKRKLEHFLHRWMKNREHNNFWLTIGYTYKSIYESYASIGTGSSRIGGWYTTIMKLPFIFCIRIGFVWASFGGSCSLLCSSKRISCVGIEKVLWNS
ncbi:hypothetical protein M9H77_23627 [Catharanthus roseus]|uniref:Uncharacterized protein n=1 Tax=Catharanthus roseus TaxID=4058 RepID=A0ACC0AW00_CATRO|nr:hypothetical protein M9H77_23627 [Catharanthus roseus]